VLREWAISCWRKPPNVGGWRRCDPAVTRLNALAEEFEAKRGKGARAVHAAAQQHVANETAPDAPMAAMKPPDAPQPECQASLPLFAAFFRTRSTQTHPREGIKGAPAKAGDIDLTFLVPGAASARERQSAV
jgi:hypothetical protein